MTFKIFKIFLSNIFSLSEFFEGFKKGPKGIAKNIVIILAFIYCLVAFSGMYIMMMTGTYNNLRFLGQTELFPGIALAVSVIVVLNFGLVSVASSYFAGSGEEQFLALPIKPKEFFGAKFGISFLTDAIIGIFLFAVSSGVYGLNEGLLGNPLFYVGTLVTAVTSSIVSVAFIYFLLIVILLIFPGFRKKSILTGIASAFVILFALVIGFSSGYFSSTTNFNDGVNFGSIPFSGITNALGELSVVRFFAKAIEGNILSICILLCVSALILFVVNPLLGKLYIKTFEGASDVKTKRLSINNVDNLLTTTTKQKSVLKTMYFRDVKGVLREPTFFANGPLMVLLFPLIIGFSMFIPLIASGENISEVFVKLSDEIGKLSEESLKQINYFVCFGGSAFAMLIGNMSNIASSSFSREGKQLYTLKSLPIENKIIVKAKFLHAMTYVVVAYLIVVLFMIVGINIVKLPFSFFDIICNFVIMGLVVFSISALLVILDMLLDTANPKLMWENPTAAFKQNMNLLLSILFSLVLFGGFVVLGIFMPHKLMLLIIIGIVAAVITIPVWHGYLKYAVKKINLM